MKEIKTLGTTIAQIGHIWKAAYNAVPMKNPRDIAASSIRLKEAVIHSAIQRYMTGLAAFGTLSYLTLMAAICSSDCNDPVVKIEIVPLECQKLPHPQARIEGREIEKIRRVSAAAFVFLSGMIQKRTGIFEAPIFEVSYIAL